MKDINPNIEAGNIKTPPSLPNFSDWQVQIMRKWAEAESASAAAEKLGISEHTYLTHLKRMRAKLAVHRTFDVYQHLQSRELL